MSILKYIERLILMDRLIKRKATGNPNEFAQKLRIRKSVLMDELKELKILGARIKYSRANNTYFYLEEFNLVIGKINDSKKS